MATVDKTRPGDGRAPRRGRHAGPLRRRLRRHHARRHGRPQRLRLEARARESTSSTRWSTRSSSRSRCCRAACAPTAEFIRRVYLDLTGLPPTPDEVRAFLADQRDTQDQARRADRQAGRQPRLRGALDQQVGRPAAGQSQVPRRRRAPARSATGFSKAVAEQHALRQVRLRRPDGQRLERSTIRRPPTSRSLRTPDDGDGEHHAPVPGRALQLQQVPRSPVRALDAGPVLPHWRRTSRRWAAAEDPKYKGQRIGGTAVEGAVPLVEVITDTGAGEVKHDSHRRSVAAPKFPFMHDGPGPGARRRGASSWPSWITVEGEPVLRPQLRQPRRGAICSASA